MANKSGSQVGLSISLIFLGGVFIIGGMGGTLANALAGLWVPDILVDNAGKPASKGGIPQIPFVTEGIVPAAQNVVKALGHL